MKTRKEIENLVIKEWESEGNIIRMDEGNPVLLILEVVLDIRDLLTPQP